MALPPDPDDWHKRYAVIEKVYCEGRWSTVLEAGTGLLRELLDAEGVPEAKALRHRMQLLLAHTLLHGYGDRDAAEDLYDVVRNSDAEPTLRQIAEDGLDQCHQPLTSTMAPEEEDDEPVPSRPFLFLPETERAELEEGFNPSERSKASPPASQMPQRPLELTPWPEVEPEEDDKALPEEERPAGLGAAVDPFGPSEGQAPSPAQGAQAPVMPWLSEPPPATDPEPGETPALPWLAQPQPLALIPDVVEEPELIEVHQATPSLAEEVDLQIQPSTARVGQEEPLQDPDEDGELRTGLLLVVMG